MALPLLSISAITLPALLWMPTLGLLLAGLGVLLLGIGLFELRLPPGRPVMAMGRSAEGVAALSDVAAASSTGAVVGQMQSEATTGAGTSVRVAPRRPLESGACLGANLAKGQRAESMHLSTVPVRRPADCGDVRDALMGLASLHHVGRDGDVAAMPNAFAGDGLDQAAAALYGPPDRQAQAALETLLEEGEPNGGRGQAREYLERTAARRFLVP